MLTMACVSDENTPPNLDVLPSPVDKFVKIPSPDLGVPAHSVNRGTKSKRGAADCSLSSPVSKRLRLSSLLALPVAPAYGARLRVFYDASTESVTQCAALALVCTSRLRCVSRFLAARMHYQLQRVPRMTISHGSFWRECRLSSETLKAGLNQARGAGNLLGDALFDAAISSAAVSAAVVLPSASHVCVKARTSLTSGMQSLDRCAAELQAEQRMLQQQWQQRRQQRRQQQLLRSQKQDRPRQQVQNHHQVAASPAGTVSTLGDSDVEEDAAPG